MKKAKIVKNNKKEEIKDIEQSYSLKTLLLIITILVIVFVVFYFITTLVVKPAKDNSSNSNSITELDSLKITIDHLLSKKEDEYYVLATRESLYTDKMNYIKIYDSYIKDYNLKENHLPVYKIDLDDALNKNYIGKTTNITDSLNELSLNDEVLFYVKNGKIEKYYIGNEQIVKALKELN